MPQQEVFFEQQTGDWRIEVLKTYDRSYAREVFGSVNDEAKRSLAAALEIAKNYDPEDIQIQMDKTTRTSSREELSEASLEDIRQSPRLYSFFVVTETKAGKARGHPVSRRISPCGGLCKGAPSSGVVLLRRRAQAL